MDHLMAEKVTKNKGKPHQKNIVFKVMKFFSMFLLLDDNNLLCVFLITFFLLIN